MKREKISSNVYLEKDEHVIHLEFLEPQEILSSAVLNGGFSKADHLVNLRVPKRLTTSEEPEVTLTKYCQKQHWEGISVGMMTAASMNSFRLMKKRVNDVEISILMTAGLSNPRRAGDIAEYREILPQKKPVIGTINIFALTNISLTQAAMVEAAMIVTEAKSAALQDAGVLSPISHEIATGTGTDSVAIISGNGLEKIRYCGKHVLFGEILGRLTYDALMSSINKKPNL